jgi:demethylspheroidene O-methyltransferase
MNRPDAPSSAQPDTDTGAAGEAPTGDTRRPPPRRRDTGPSPNGSDPREGAKARAGSIGPGPDPRSATMPPEGERRGGILEFLRQRWIAVLSSPRFQRWAAAFPLTRPIALSRSRQVFDLCAGFVYSQTLLAFIRMDLFDRLAQGGAQVATLARELDVPPARLRRFLGAGVALKLLRWKGPDEVALGPLGAPLVGNEALARMVEHNVLFYHDLADPMALLRGESPEHSGLQQYWAYAGRKDRDDLDPEAVAAYSDLMAASQPLVSREILDGYDFGEHTRILDVGGGEGAFLRAVAERHPELELALFDLPQVAHRAQRRLHEFPHSERVLVTGGDFLRDPLPDHADLVTLVRILHDHDDADVQTLLSRIRGILPDNGTLLVAEPMSGVRGAETVGSAYFALYLMAMGQGRPRTPEELTQLLREAGFSRVRHPRPRSPVLTSLLIARP